MPQSDYDVNINIKARDQTSHPAKQAGKSLDLLATAAKVAGAAMVAMQVAKVAADMAGLGIKVQATQQRFDQFAGGADRAAMFLDSFNEGTGYTVDKMAAMQSGARLLQMGLVETGDEMSQIASMATKLGDQTQGSGERIADFAALLANQSIPRLDNFGISSGRVRARIDELLKSGQAVGREEAFKMAVMEEGAKALDTLGDVSQLSSVKIEILAASLKTAKQGFAEIIAEDIAGLAGDIDSVGEATRTLPDRFREWREGIQSTTFAHRASNEEIRAAREANMAENEAIRQASEATRAMQIDLVTGTKSREQYNDAIAESMRAMDQATISATDYYNRQQLLAATAGVDSSQSFGQYQDAIIQAQGAQDDAKFSAMQLTNQLAKEAEAAAIAGMAQLNMSMSFTNTLDQMKESAAKFAEDRETLDAQHQEKLAEIARKGQGWRKQVDVEGTQLELRIDQGRLAQMLARQAEFDAETTDLERAQTEKSISGLQGEIQEKTELLQSAQNGYVVMAGQNTDALVAEETRRHEESVKLLDAQMEKQAQVQEQALGAMMLQSFDAWKEGKEIPVERMLEMRTAIAEEYGLVGAGSTELVTDMVSEWDRWADDTKIATDDVVTYMDNVIDATGNVDKELLDLTAQEWVIRVRYNLTLPPVPQPDGDPNPPDNSPFRAGPSFSVGGTSTPGAGAFQMGGGPTYNETFNIYDPRAMAVIQENQRRQRRASLSRYM